MDEKFTKRFESFKNSLAHDYDGTIVTNCCQTIISTLTNYTTTRKK